MGILNRFKNAYQGFKVNEAMQQFARKGESAPDRVLAAERGEGYEFIEHPYSSVSMSTFNLFYSTYINKQFKNEVEKIMGYRNIAEFPEIADVIEDIIVESSQEDLSGDIIHLRVVDEDLSKNENTVENLEKEFNDLFNKKIKLSQVISDLLRTYYIDGRLYYERLINKNKVNEGIIGIKKLPSETMDFEYDQKTLKITRFFQYLSESAKRPKPGEPAGPGVIEFEPEQIGFVDYGVHGKNKYDIIGYLEKAKIPYNQLKLLETSVIIYRLVRAPERFVFKIDVGQMPRDKALKYVEEVKNRMIKRPTYDPQTGTLTNSPEIFSILDNFFIPTSSDGRGADVTTVGGNPSGFAELGDINYFQRKLYKALKYPMSRVNAKETSQDAQIVFSSSPVGEISRDEIKWATFLERHQNRICNELEKMFLLHLEFKGIKKEYNLDVSKISITLNPPSFYKSKQQQLVLESKFANYLALSNQQEFAKTFLMERYLELTEEEIQKNSDDLKKDIKYGFKEAPIEPTGPSTAGALPKEEETPPPKKEKKPAEEEEEEE